MNIVVVIPTYNEAENIGKMLDVLVHNEFPKVKDHKLSILVVDSNSPDGTGDIVKKKMKLYKQVHLLMTEKGGLGADYAKGMKYAMTTMHADALIEFDADFQHNPSDIPRLIAAYTAGGDYIIGSRYVPGGKIPAEWGMDRKLMSFFGSQFARWVMFFPRIHDLTSGLKLTSTKFLKKVDLDHLLSKGYAYKIHILHDVVKLGAHVVEVPISFRERKEGVSKISQKDLIDSFLVVITLRLRDSERLIKFATVGFIGFVINAFFLSVFSRMGFVELASWALSTEIAIVSNFILNNLWTFKSEQITGVSKLISRFLQFNFTSTGALILQTLLGTLGVSVFGQQYRLLLLPFIVAFVVLPYNYFMYNVVIWRRWKLPRSSK